MSQTTESGLQYKVLKEGDGISPGPKDSVKVNYRGTFIDGTEFDNSYEKGEPITVQTDRVIKGWTEALQMMKVGSKWQIFVPPELGYGRRGSPGKIPPNKVLVFEMELMDVEKGDQADQSSGSQTVQTPPVRKMTLTGEIAKSRNGYVIRSKRGDAPSEIYTIRNPDPKVLDGLVNSEKIVTLEVRIISGDNVNIETIDGQQYPVKRP